MSYELPARKIGDITRCLQVLLVRRRVPRRELLSLIGKLVHACRCVPPGRGFLRRLLDAAHSVSQQYHRVRVTRSVRADMVWWAEFAPRWNGTFPILPPAPPCDAGATLSTNSSRRGMGAVWGGRWWAAEWPAAIVADEQPSMTLLEILPILIAAVVWDDHWRGTRVTLYSDNMGVVGAWGWGWSREARTMAVIRQLLFRAACGGYTLDIRFVAGVENGPADALSRGDMDRFRRLVPGAGPVPSPLPQGWIECVADPVASSHVLTGVRL